MAAIRKAKPNQQSDAKLYLVKAKKQLAAFEYAKRMWISSGEGKLEIRTSGQRKHY
jgi:hypothetical protein